MPNGPGKDNSCGAYVTGRFGRLRYLVHFSDGGSGMRHRDARLEEGDELSGGAQQYIVERVEQAPNPSALGHAWARLVVLKTSGM